MVAIPGNFRNSVSLPEDKALPKPMQRHQAIAAKAQAIAQSGSSSGQAMVALDGLSDLIAAQAMGDEAASLELESDYKETYELYGHPDPFQALLALLDRPVGMGVVRRSRTVQVLQADGSYTTEVRSEAQYYQRAYTGDELQYLDRQDRARGKRRARLGEMDYTLAPPPQPGQRPVTPHLQIR